MNHSFFRGGGLICSYQHIEVNINQNQSIMDQEQLQEFFLDLDSKCFSLNDLSKSIQSIESQVKIIKIVRQILFQSQFINQASRDTVQTRQYIRQIINNLEILLDCITNTISHRHITLQIFKICNQISRLIFQYYANDYSIPLDQEKQQSQLSLIKQIEGLLSQEGEQLYYNSIYYELFIIKICIEICPTNSEEGKEVLLNILSSIKASLSEMSADLLICLAQGGSYLDIFKIILYLEEFKFSIIERIQQGQGINKIIKQLTNNYNTLIKDSNEWLIRCSWIKIISELITYQPIITYKQFQITKFKYQLQIYWDNLLEKRIIKLIDDKSKIAIIQQNNQTSQINRILQQQILKFQVLQNCIIKGEKNLPKLEQLSEFANLKQAVNNQQNKYIEQFQNIPISQFIEQLKEYTQKIIKYLELIQDFIEEIQNKNNKQYLLTQIEFIISESEDISKSWHLISLHNDIIYDLLNTISSKISNDQQSSLQINLLINSTLYYFKIAEILDYKFENLISEYQVISAKLLDQYNFDVQLQKIQNIQDDNVGKLIQKLQEMERNSKIINKTNVFFDYIKMVPIITHQIQQDRAILINYNLAFFKIRCILEFSNQPDHNYQTQIKDQIPKELFQHMFLNYSAIQTLIFIYEQINDNQDILIKNILNDQSLKPQIGINLQTIQLNNRIQELTSNQKITLIKLQELTNQESTLYQKIQYLGLMEHVYENELRQLKILTNDISWQIERIDQLTKSKKLENQQNQIEDQINENFNLLCIDENRFIELIKKRLELYSQLEKDYQDLNINDMQLLQLIIEDDQQKYQNTSQDIIKVIKEQNTKFNKKTQIQNNESVIMIYQSYLLNLLNMIKDNDFNKNQEKSRILISEMNNIINYIKLQIFQNKPLEQLKCLKYGQIVEEFQSLFSVNVDKVEDNLKQQLSILQQQEQKLSLDEVITIIPSYRQLSDRVLDNSKKLSIKQKALQFINDKFTNEMWRVKDYLYYNCLEFYKQINENNQKIVGQFILIARFKETDYRIINTLKGKDQIQQMDLVINNQWEDTQDQINNDLQLTLNQLQALQLSLQSEERKDVRDELLQKHKYLEQQLEQQMKNVKEIGDVLDIKKDLVLIQNKLDNIINSIDLIGQDIKFLRGKTSQQLLEIRMQSVFENKLYQNSQSVYVQMKTQEFDFNTNLEKLEQTPLFNFDNLQNGEIDEFLLENKKSSLLIHGVAGSGKSLTARKIEEYLWQQYKKQCLNKLWSDIQGTPPQIPIFIQLPTLKEPKFNAVEETLLSLYRFDQKQIDQLKDITQQNLISLIFIMDSYDELPQQYQGTNLLQSNKIHLWKSQNQLQIPKVITTSRSEAFTTNDYRAWFWENDTYGFQSLKEIRLLPFDLIQRQEFLKQFSLLKLKIQIFDLLSNFLRYQQHIFIVLAIIIKHKIRKYIFSNRQELVIKINHNNQRQQECNSIQLRIRDFLQQANLRFVALESIQ
ncbi:hypothetical protein pb186bvf_014409 [Paramecium bursaria]